MTIPISRLLVLSGIIGVFWGSFLSQPLVGAGLLMILAGLITLGISEGKC